MAPPLPPPPACSAVIPTRAPTSAAIQPALLGVFSAETAAASSAASAGATAVVPVRAISAGSDAAPAAARPAEAVLLSQPPFFAVVLPACA